MTDNEDDEVEELLTPEELERAQALQEKIAMACVGHSYAVVAQAMLGTVEAIAGSWEKKDPSRTLPVVLAELVYQWESALSSGDAMNFWDRLEELTDGDDELPEGQFEN